MCSPGGSLPCAGRAEGQTASRERQHPGNGVEAAGSLGTGAGSVRPWRASGWEPQTPWP